MPVPSHIAALRDAVAAALNDEANASVFQVQFTAVGRNTLILDPVQLNTLRVSVFPADYDADLETRANETTEVISLGVAVQIHPNTDLPADTDPYLMLSEAITNFFRGERLEIVIDADGNTISYMCTEAKLKPVLSQEHMLKHQIFTSVALLQFSTLF